LSFAEIAADARRPHFRHPLPTIVGGTFIQHQQAIATGDRPDGDPRRASLLGSRLHNETTFVVEFAREANRGVLLCVRGESGQDELSLLLASLDAEFTEVTGIFDRCDERRFFVGKIPRPVGAFGPVVFGRSALGLSYSLPTADEKLQRRQTPFSGIGRGGRIGCGCDHCGQKTERDPRDGTRTGRHNADLGLSTGR
jgi:hypothetical protein